MNTLHTIICGIGAAILLTFLSCSIMSAKKPVFKKTVWESKQEIFVADAGTMTMTITLEFGSGKDVKVAWSSYLPAHPAMYMNADGSVDRIPASSSESVSKGIWEYKSGKLTITLESGTKSEFEYKAGCLLGGSELSGSGAMFNRIK